MNTQGNQNPNKGQKEARVVRARRSSAAVGLNIANALKQGVTVWQTTNSLTESRRYFINLALFGTRRISQCEYEYINSQAGRKDCFLTQIGRKVVRHYVCLTA